MLRMAQDCNQKKIIIKENKGDNRGCLLKLMKMIKRAGREISRTLS